MPEPILTVISDLHIGAGPLDDFEPELEQHFIRFLDALVSPTELVLNGDLLDFVQAPPFEGSHLEATSALGIPLCFTEEQSLAKLEAIFLAHQLTFQSLRRFLSNPRNQVTLLPGNHDADFFWPRVQKRFRELVGGSLRYHLDPVYRPACAPLVWIEHGHQHDPVNCFTISGYPYWSGANPPILTGTDGHQRLYECIGTRFLIQHLNALDAEYPYIDNVKPYWRFWQLFGASAFNRSAKASLKALVAVAEMGRYLAAKALFGRSDLLSVERGDTLSASPRLLEAYKAVPRADKAQFLAAVRARGFDLDSALELILSNEERAVPLMSFLSRNLDLLSPLESEMPQGTLSLYNASHVNETEQLAFRAKQIIESGDARFVVMGHTHEVVNTSAYINPGSWTRYYRVPEDRHLEPWTVLQSRSYAQWPYELNYAQLGPDGIVLCNYHRRMAD